MGPAFAGLFLGIFGDFWGWRVSTLKRHSGTTAVRLGARHDKSSVFADIRVKVLLKLY
ncbi:protein of unknown function [Burkholderia multivorans]